ncbi:uncharacterized protein LOC109717428 [Ananas comosus]|uniref:Uncharacterized protein LOC109717428 n=1 Tax=Ananas comosus TaxID=4615 RepID=A0A6P5FSB3_ANACO|nr:uncharacterized protein LOC109717428 [Ananas comosus]
MAGNDLASAVDLGVDKASCSSYPLPNFPSHTTRRSCSSLLSLSSSSSFPTSLSLSLSTISKSEMRRSNRKSTNVELRFNVPRQRAGEEEEEGGSSSASASVSPPSSCVSSEEGEQKRSESPEAAPPMVVVGCPRCLMYVMLSEDEPKCPKCKSTVLLDFHHGGSNNNNNNSSKSKKS